MRKVGASTYRDRNGYCLEKMADGTWTAYLRIDPSDPTSPWRWSAPKFMRRRDAAQAANHHAYRIGRTPLTDILAVL